jgi:hypothetical protein
MKAGSDGIGFVSVWFVVHRFADPEFYDARVAFWWSSSADAFVHFTKQAVQCD